MRILLLVLSTVLLFLTGCSFEGRGEAEAEGISEEIEVKEVKSAELDLEFEIQSTVNQALFVITLTNKSNEMKKLEFPTSQKYEIVVKNHNHEEVFRYSKGKMFSQAIETAIIKSGEKMKWEEVWEYTQLPAGKYKVEVSILAHDTDDLKQVKNLYIKKK